MAPNHPCYGEGIQSIHLKPLCTHTTILFFTFTTEFNNLHEIVNTLL